VLIVSDPCADKGKLLRAIASLWTSGEGTIQVPPAKDVLFVPARPYLPLTTLRAAITYPDDATVFEDAVVHRALERVGLQHLIERLATQERWDKILPQDEQQGLALARLLLHAPKWVFFEDTSALGKQHEAIIREIFDDELMGSTAIGCAANPGLAGFYRRTINLRRRGADVEAIEAPPTVLPLPLRKVRAA
jgi:vitamin B12/bleomycin/antimicrobial peptide transport system ATP-binding/permease protein